MSSTKSKKCKLLVNSALNINTSFLGNMQKVALVLVIVMFDMISIFGQTYTTYYYDNDVSGKINSISRIIDGKTRKMNELRFYNDGISSCTIVGYVRIRYTEINSGCTDYKEERFKLFLGAGKDETVDFYFKPSWSRYVGIYEPIGFYVEKNDCCNNNYRSNTSTYTSTGVPTTNYTQSDTDPVRFDLAKVESDIISIQQYEYNYCLLYSNGMCKCYTKSNGQGTSFVGYYTLNAKTKKISIFTEEHVPFYFISPNEHTYRYK